MADVAAETPYWNELSKEWMDSDEEMVSLHRLGHLQRQSHRQGKSGKEAPQRTLLNQAKTGR